MDSKDKQQFDKIKNLIESRAYTYDHCLLGISFEVREGSYLPCYISLTFKNSLKKVDDLRYNYDGLTIIRKLISIERSIEFLHEILAEGKVKVDEIDTPIITRSGNRGLQHTRVRDYYGFLDSEWPSKYASFSIEDNTVGHLPWELSTQMDAPIFPSGQLALVNLFNLKLPKNYSTINQRVEILMPDYRAKITNLRLSGNIIKLEIDSLEENLVSKFYVETETRVYTSEEITVTNGSSSYQTEESPVMIEAHLFSKSSNEFIDKIKFDYSKPGDYSGVILEDDEQQIIDIIARGETNQTEFKRSLNPSNSEDFSDSVVAFSNSFGGTIFIGVEDDGSLSEGNKSVMKDKVTDIISEFCYPRIEPIITDNFLVQGKNVTIVRIPEGKNKPYFHRKRGMRIRAGATDRHINRVELEKIYNDKTVQNLNIYR